jgi:transcriptional regulator with XRE-family HTH domain
MDLANLDAGRALRVLMSADTITADKIGGDLGVSSTTISTLRREKFISGKNLSMLANYFKMSAADFIRKGEE